MHALLPMPSRVDRETAFRRLDAAQRQEYGVLMRFMIRCREWPDLALMQLTGVYLPTHQRTLLYQLARGAGTNIAIGSRGTAKSSTICVLFANWKQLFFPKRTAVTLSFTGFRGGQLIFTDVERWLKGGWNDQRTTPGFFVASIDRPQILTKAANYWSLEYTSYSKNLTLPTKDHDAIRGVRGNDLLVDEANFVSKDLIDRVAKPFLNVKGGFRSGGAFSDPNQVFLMSTIDFSWRPFQDEVRAAVESLQRDYAAAQAMREGNWERYEELDRAGLFQFVLVRFDYTDLIIREEQVTRDGRRFRVTWPNKEIPRTVYKAGIPFTQRDPDGRMLLHGPQVAGYCTYPLDKETMERGLLAGSADTAAWLSEQRNIEDSAAGDVYPNDVIDRVTSSGDHCILPYEELGPEWAKAHKDRTPDYTGPILWRCTDPCVLGVDYAPTSDFTAFVVIRMGPLAAGTFDPLTHHGKTPWSNVIWCEQHQKMTSRAVADKIRQLIERYNLVYYDDPQETDPWLHCRAIGLDMRGGGSAVRDELAWINEPDGVVPVGQFRIYDPKDPDERFAAMQADATARPMLDSIFPSDQFNDRLVEFSLNLMRQSQLFLPKYIEITDRPKGQRELHIGYDAARVLDRQLRKLRQAPTANYRKFYVDGDRRTNEGKKDLWSAFIYALKQGRAHLIRQAMIDNTPPPIGAVMTQIGRFRRSQFGGKAYGSRI